MLLDLERDRGHEGYATRHGDARSTLCGAGVRPMIVRASGSLLITGPQEEPHRGLEDGAYSAH